MMNDKETPQMPPVPPQLNGLFGMLAPLVKTFIADLDERFEQARRERADIRRALARIEEKLK